MTAPARDDDLDLIENYLTEGEQREWEALAESDWGGETLRDFICRVAPHEPPPKHLDPILEALERCRTIGGQRIAISIPPRHAKSTTIRRMLAWWTEQRPADHNAYVSRTCDGAEAQSRKIRTLCQEIGVPLAPGAKRNDNWETIYGGGLIACGIDGMLTGNPVTGLAVVDDPIKNRQEASSEAYRERVNDFVSDVLMTRLEGPASVIIIHTRWDPDDLIGTLEAEGGWTIINLPALAEENDPIGRKPGEALWPERFPIERLEKIRRRNEFTFESLYQGKPVPKGARMFYGPTRYWDPKKTDLRGCTVIIGGDPAATAKTTADFSVYVAIAVREPWDMPTVYLLDLYRKQVEVPEQARAALKFQRRNFGAKIWVEAVAGFKAVPQLLRSLCPGVLVGEIDPKGDKKQRAEGVASAWNDGRFLIPSSDYHQRMNPEAIEAPEWVKDFVNELRRFTGKEGAVDDQVDASANAYNMIGVMDDDDERGSKAEPGAYGA
jgi:predicted phage terminase large subunit-like protein